jgi:hypothetical protein
VFEENRTVEKRKEDPLIIGKRRQADDFDAWQDFCVFSKQRRDSYRI